MKLGKISETILKRSVFKHMHTKRTEVVLGPSVGEDCAMVTFLPDELCVLSTDPITGATMDIGQLGVHVTVNDLAANGAEPIGVLLTLLLPEGFLEKDLKVLMQQVDETCLDLNIQVIGGHTEVTKAVNQPVISVTGVGKVSKAKRVINQEARPGMAIVMTKWAGIEGTAILAKEKEMVLKNHFNPAFIDSSIALSQHLSVLKESRIAVENGAKAMHDATEGGIFGALWELGASADLGLEVDLTKILIKQETIEICDFFDLNPYKLMSSGVMLIVTEAGGQTVMDLQAAGIEASIIGYTNETKHRTVMTPDGIRSLEPAQADELYKVI